MKMLTYSSAIAASALVMAAPAHAVTTLYSGQDINPVDSGVVGSNPNSDAAAAAFNAVLTGTSTESFEGFTPGTPAPLNLSFTGSAGTLGATLTGSGLVASATRSSPTGSGQFAVGGSNYYFVDSSNFTINFDQDIAAFGFYATDLEDLQNIDITLNYAAGGSISYNLETVFRPPAPF